MGKTVLHQAAKNSRVRRADAEEAEEREGCGHCAPQHKPVLAGEVPGGRCAAGPRPGCFLSLLCISETSGSLCAPEDREGCSKGGG